MNKLLLSRIITGILVVVFVTLFLVALFRSVLSDRVNIPFIPGLHVSQKGNISKDFFKSFSSADDMRRYMDAWSADMYVGNDVLFAARDMQVLESANMGTDAVTKSSTGDATNRVSDTNVQVPGIDEPDIVKTDGKELYISRGQTWYGGVNIPMGEPAPMTHVQFDGTDSIESSGSADVPVSAGVESVGQIAEDSSGTARIFPPREQTAGVNIVSAFPVENMKVDGEIPEQGEMLLDRNALVILSNQGIRGFNVSNPQDPQSIWTIRYEDAVSLADARMKDGVLYTIVRTNIDVSVPCPIRPFSVNGSNISIACTDIWYPKDAVSPEALYTVSKIDMQTGELLASQTMLGTYNMTMAFFDENLYLGYTKRAGVLDVMSDFFRENPQLIPQNVFTRIEKIHDYDISEQSKLTEFRLAISRYEASLSADERLRFTNELNNAQEKYLEKRKRDLVETCLVRMNVDTLQADAVGTFPGTLLNRFSIDAYNEHVRVATTIGASIWQFGNQVEQTNDLYVLDDDMNTVGSVRNFGDDERIYSVRFLGDEGYVVTFKQTDPFFVFDLSDPKEPKKVGELKIPGYSSYLHPLRSGRVLGVGKEGNSVKMSLFDVSDASAPKELNTYQLNEYWSDVLNTHHAFLQDEKHEVFFMPGSNGGYVFSYGGDKLEMVKAVSGGEARRAVYIDDYLYIIGNNVVTVVNENDWNTVKTLDL